MRLVEKERGQFPKVKVAYVAIPCMQCDNAVCLQVAEDGAVYQRADGIVIIDPAKAVDQKQLVDACPHRSIFWNEEKRLAQKCTFCAHLLDQGWREPRCVEACPTGALVFGDLDDPSSEISRLVASGEPEALHPEYGLGDSVRYIGLPKRFVAGAVVFADGERCGEGAQVLLEGEELQRTATADSYGDFEFEGLPIDETFTVTVAAPGYGTKQLTVRTHRDAYLGEIELQPVGGQA
jgi:Fe-S-cluster-containing dehydrogenase component